MQEVAETDPLHIVCHSRLFVFISRPLFFSCFCSGVCYWTWGRRFTRHQRAALSPFGSHSGSPRTVGGSGKLVLLGRVVALDQ